MYDPVISHTSPFIYNLRSQVVNGQTIYETSHNVAYELTTLQRRVLVRLTGGCGSLPDAQGAAMYQLFVDGFAGFNGAMLFGGTRMLRMPDNTEICPGITEVAPMILRANKDCRILGIVPLKTPPMVFDQRLGAVVEHNSEYTTIINPSQNYCLTIAASPDNGVIWEEEYKFCLQLTRLMRDRAKFRSVLVCYNGGDYTEQELLATADEGWPVLLIAGSGGQTEAYARNSLWLKQHPNVHSCEATAASLHQALVALKVLPASKLAQVVSLPNRKVSA